MMAFFYGMYAMQQQSSFSQNVLPWAVWFLTACFYLYENVIQVSPGVMVPDLMSAFAINSATLGGLIAFFFYAYAGMQIPVGVLADHFDARYLLTAACIACAVGCVLFGVADHLVIAAFGRLLIGFGSAFAAVCSMKIASTWFDVRRFSFLVGLLVTMGMFGSMLGEQPLAFLVESVGWRHTLFVLAAIGGVLALLIFAIVRNEPITTAKKIEQHSEHQPVLKGLMVVLSCRQSWILAIYGGAMFASTSIFGGLWGVPFLMKAYLLDRPTAAGIVSLLFFGWMVGAPCSGILVDWFGGCKKNLWLSSAGCLVVSLLLLYVPIFSLTGLSLLMFSFGFFSALFLPSFSLIHDLHTKQHTGAALGFMNTANMVGGALGQPLIGWVLDFIWDGRMDANVRVYALLDYQYALMCMPIIIASSLLLLPFIKEKEA